MSVSAVKQRLLETSGRYDLTSEDLLWVLNKAQRSLDSKTRNVRSDAREILQLPAGNSHVLVPDIRALKEVWLHGSQGKIRCDISMTISDLRHVQGYNIVQSEVQEMLGLTPPLPLLSARVYCVEDTDRRVGTFEDTTVLTRTNLINGSTGAGGLGFIVTPPAPTELSILIEDGLLLPSNPHLEITSGTITFVGTDLDGAVLTEVVSCAGGAGFYKTENKFKSVGTITTAGFNRLVTGDEKLTVKTGRRSFIEDLDLTDDFSSKIYTFFPTIEESVMVEIFGDFYSPSLVNDTDKTFWTERYDDVLILQARMMLDRNLRNRQGILDFQYALEEPIKELNFDYTWSIESKRRPTIRG